MAGEDPTDTPQVIKVADGLYVRQEVDNIAWIDMGTYALVVDALEQASLEREVLDAMELTIGRKPVRYVLNTHTHYDHTALNEAFRRHFGAEIVNQDTCGIPADGRWFEGRRRVWMFPAPGCHTDEDCCVWCPDDGALFVGDIFGWGLIPLTRPLRGDTVRLLEETYARLIDLGAGTVVPGHGPICSTAELRRWVEYLHWLIAEVNGACAAGKSDEEVLDEVAPPDDMLGWWRFVKWKHTDSVQKVLRSARKGQLPSA
jgi:cyclase